MRNASALSERHDTHNWLRISSAAAIASGSMSENSAPAFDKGCILEHEQQPGKSNEKALTVSVRVHTRPDTLLRSVRSGHPVEVYIAQPEWIRRVLRDRVLLMRSSTPCVVVKEIVMVSHGGVALAADLVVRIF